MTATEYISKVKAIEDQQKELSELRKRLWAELLKTCPFKRGDKVLVRSGNVEKLAFIGEINQQYFLKEGRSPFRYEFNACKKDGTMGQNSAGIYSYTSVTLAP